MKGAYEKRIVYKHIVKEFLKKTTIHMVEFDYKFVCYLFITLG